MESSPFSYIPNTNVCPSPSDYEAVKRLISAKRAENAALAVEIAQAKAALLAAETRLSANEKFIQEHARLISPIRRIPLDILTMIFILCLEEDRPLYEHEHCITSSKHPSIRLSQVCGAWRQAALGTRRLWASIRVALPGIGRRGPGWWNSDRECRDTYTLRTRQAAARTHAFTAWAQRSSDCPLDITLEVKALFTTPSEHQRAFMASYQALLDTVLQSSTRWRAVHFTFPLESSVAPAMALLQPPPALLPILSKTTVTVTNDASPEAEEESSKQRLREILSGGLFTAPSVRSASLSNDWRRITYPEFSHAIQRWKTLTSLSIAADKRFGWDLLPLTSREARELLCALPNLTSFTVWLEDDEGATLLAEPRSVTLPNLETLQLSGYPVSRGFAQYFHLPRLDSLHLCHFELPISYRRLDENHSGVVELVTRFGHQLKSLSIGHDAITRSAFRICLENVPNVVDLDLSPIYFEYKDDLCEDEDVFALSELTVQETTNGHPKRVILCPKLERFSMLGQNEPRGGATEKALVEFIAGRRVEVNGTTGETSSEAPRFARIQEVNVDFLRTAKVDIWKELRERNVDLRGFNAHFDYADIE